METIFETNVEFDWEKADYYIAKLHDHKQAIIFIVSRQDKKQYVLKINLLFDKENWEYFNGKISNEAVVLADNKSDEAKFFVAPKQTTVVMTGELNENKIPKLKYYANWIPKGTKVESFQCPEKF